MVWRLIRQVRLSEGRAEVACLLPRGHIPALDAVRGLAIIMVTLYRFGGGGDGPASAIPHHWSIDLGMRGVDLFFVLSGFLITGILFDAKGKEHYFRNFYLRRSLRIFPLYYGTLAAIVLASLVSTSAAQVFAPAAERQMWLWLYGGNILQSLEGEWCLGPLNHFWSLAIEEHFYLLWPLVIYCCSRRSAMWTCGIVIAASVLGRAAWCVAGGNDVAAEVLTPLRMDGLAIGSWVALAARGELGLARLARWAWPVAISSGLFAVVLVIGEKRLLGLPHFVWACFFAAALVILLAAPTNSRLTLLGHSRVLRFFGKYSYAMYVFQNLLIPLVAGVITAPMLAANLGSPALGQIVYCAVMFAATTAVALLSWHAFERHFLRLKDRLGHSESK